MRSSVATLTRDAASEVECALKVEVTLTTPVMVVIHRKTLKQRLLQDRQTRVTLGSALRLAPLQPLRMSGRLCVRQLAGFLLQ
jgi:hypothetical protein